MGGKRECRPVTGILLLDKPAGITSNQALQKVKFLYASARGGHTGNLDRPATGMLPVCLGQATKCSQYLLDADKGYRAVCRLGLRTDTADMSGKVIQRGSVPAFDAARLEATLQGFLGEISQIPPMYSAIKHQGQRLYTLAGRGEEVERQPRLVRIRQISLLSVGEEDFEFEVRCSKGTYIRTLAEDIASALGGIGCLASLRRLYSAPFQGMKMHALEALEAVAERGREALDALLLPPESALPDWIELRLPPESMRYFCQGQAVVPPPGALRAPKGGLVRVHDRNGRMVAIGVARSDGRIGPKKMML